MADFTASGTSPSWGVGASFAPSSFAAAGAGAANAGGVGVRRGVGAAAGVAGGTVVGRNAGVGVGSSIGTDVALAAAIGIGFVVAAGSGSGAVQAVGVSAGIFSASGTSTAASLPSTATGVAAGSSAAVAMLSSSVAAAAGSAAASAATHVLWGGAGASQGLAVATGIGGISWASVANESDLAIAIHGLTVVQAGNATSDASVQTAVYASSGAASSAVDWLEKRNAVGLSDGVAVAAFRAELSETLVSSAAAADSLQAGWKATELTTGAASNENDVLQRRYVVGACASISIATGLGIGGTNGVGESVGASGAIWVGRGVTVTTGAASGTSSALGLLVGVSRAVAYAAGVSSAIAVRKGKQQEILVSSGVASDSMQFPVPTVYPVFWSNTIGASGATWEGLPFNSMVEADGVVYAAGVSGLYRLVDLADDNGTDVVADVQWDLADHSDYKQRARSIYVHAIADGPFTVKVENKQGRFSYQTHLPYSTKMMNHRAPIGRGITSRAMRLSLQHTLYFSVADVTLESGDTTRRI